MHEVLVNRLGGLSLPRKSVVRLTDRPDMILDVYRGRKTTIQPTNQPSRTMLDDGHAVHIRIILSLWAGKKACGPIFTRQQTFLIICLYLGYFRMFSISSQLVEHAAACVHQKNNSDGDLRHLVNVL